MSTIDLMIDEENELTFQVQIEGTRPGSAKCRLMLESKEMALAFVGQSTGDEVSVTLPPLDSINEDTISLLTKVPFALVAATISATEVSPNAFFL